MGAPAEATPLTVAISPGDFIAHGGKTYLIVRLDTTEAVLCRDVSDGSEVRVPISEIAAAAPKSSTVRDLSTIPADHWNKAVRRRDLLLRFFDDNDRSVAAVDRLALSEGVSRATIYRWIKRFDNGGAVTDMVRRRRSDNGKPRTKDKRLVALIEEVIQSEYLNKQRKSLAAAYRVLQERCRLLRLKPISRPTFVRRIDAFTPHAQSTRRGERHAASRLTPMGRALADVTTPLQVIQIDHTLLDLELVDSRYRAPIGRPWITVAIDVFSRVVVGWYVSFDSPGTLATGVCIVQGILPKHELLRNLGVDYAWPCQGKPARILLDNAKEFRGNSLERACQEHGIDLQFRPVKTPQFGAHIERLMGTLATWIHELPGTTFSNVQERKDYDSAANAVLTLGELEAWLAELILGRYHNTKHEGIGCSPLSRFREGIEGSDDAPGIGVLPVVGDPQRLLLDFLPSIERSVSAQGIVLDGIFYYSSALTRWIGSRDKDSRKEARRFVCKRDPRDISHIWFFDPDLQTYLEVPYRDSSHPAISLWELKAAQRYLKERGDRSQDEDAVFRAATRMRSIVVDSTDKTRDARRQQERVRQHEKQRKKAASSPKPKRVARVAVALPQANRPDEEDYSDVTPFDEIEVSQSSEK